MSSEDISICAVCAWRGTCQKKFNVSGKSLRCTDFVRDISIEPAPKEEPEEDKK